MTGSTRKYLIFALGDTRYALDLCQAAEVEELPVLWPIPAAPSCYTGAMNFHGAIVAVMDLAAFLSIPGSHPSEKVVVLDPAIASLAFLVEHVIRIVQVDSTEIEPSTGEDFVTARLMLGDGTALLLDAVKIAERAAQTING